MTTKTYTLVDDVIKNTVSEFRENPSSGSHYIAFASYFYYFPEIWSYDQNFGRTTTKIYTTLDYIIKNMCTKYHETPLSRSYFMANNFYSPK